MRQELLLTAQLGDGDGARCSSCRKGLDAFGQAVIAEGTTMGLDGAVVIDEDKRRLAGYAVETPQRTIDVDGVRKALHSVGRDELIYRTDVVLAWHANKGDVGTVLLKRRCDRRGFCSASRSPRSPEPQHRVGAFERVPFQLAAVEGQVDDKTA